MSKVCDICGEFLRESGSHCSEAWRYKNAVCGHASNIGRRLEAVEKRLGEKHLCDKHNYVYGGGGAWQCATCGEVRADWTTKENRDDAEKWRKLADEVYLEYQAANEHYPNREKAGQFLAERCVLREEHKTAMRVLHERTLAEQDAQRDIAALESELAKWKAIAADIAEKLEPAAREAKEGK